MMSERERKRIRQPGRSRQKQSKDGSLWPVFVVVALIFSIGGFSFLRNVLGSPATTSGTSDTGAAATSSVPGTATPAAGTPSSGPGEAVALQVAQHVGPGQTHPDYNSDPPTSGWHLDRAIPAGFYDAPQVDEALVHNLEHGHIVIAYDCEKLDNPSTALRPSSGQGSGQRCDEVKARLKAIVDRYDGWKVTVIPRQNKDTPLALTAWGRIDRLDGYDEARITTFIDAYRDQGPEKTPE
jgi:hypothetical protein